MNGTAKWMIGLLLSAALFFLPWAGAFSQLGTATAAAKADEDRASDFVLKDLDGKDVRLSQYKGRVVFLIFGTTWCPQCRQELSSYKEIYSRYGSKGLIVLYINVMESQRKAAAYAKKYALPYPTLLDTQGKVMADYGVLGVPAKVLIDKNGRIICWNCRSLNAMLKQRF